MSHLIFNMSVCCCVSQSKGGILSKACDYIRELRQSNQRLQDSYKEVERVEMDNELLRQQVKLQYLECTYLIFLFLVIETKKIEIKGL